MALPGVREVIAKLITPAVCATALHHCFVAADPAEVAFLAGQQYGVRATSEGRAAYLATLRDVRRDFTVGAPAYRAAIAQWSRPALVIHGCQDPVVPLAHAEAVVRGLRRVERRWLDPCRHFPQIEHADAVDDWLGEFAFAGAGR